jgi:hypothetical protein
MITNIYCMMELGDIEDLGPGGRYNARLKGTPDWMHERLVVPHRCIYSFKVLSSPFLMIIAY